MPEVELDGLDIAYEVVGEGRPWIITPGGRFHKEFGGIPEMAQLLAGHGQKVITWDRPNCGASSVVFAGRSESEIQAEALANLPRFLDVGPTIIIGGSGGAASLVAGRGPQPRRGRGAGDLVDQRGRAGTALPRQLLLHAVGRRGMARGYGSCRRAPTMAGGVGEEPAQQGAIPGDGSTGVPRGDGPLDDGLLRMRRGSSAGPRRRRRENGWPSRSWCFAAERATWPTPARPPRGWPPDCPEPSSSSHHGATPSGTSAAPSTPPTVPLASSCAGRCWYPT